MSDGGRRDLMELLGWRLVRYFVLHVVSRVKSRHLRSVGYFSRVPTYERLPLTSDQFYRTTTQGNQEAPAEVGLLDRRQAGSPTEPGFLLRFRVATAVIRFE